MKSLFSPLRIDFVDKFVGAVSHGTCMHGKALTGEVSVRADFTRL